MRNREWVGLLAHLFLQRIKGIGGAELDFRAQTHGRRDNTPNIQHAAVSIFIAANESTLMTSEYRAHERPLMIIRDNIIITRVVARLNILSGCARLCVC